MEEYICFRESLPAQKKQNEEKGAFKLSRGRWSAVSWAVMLLSHDAEKRTAPNFACLSQHKSYFIWLRTATLFCLWVWTKLPSVPECTSEMFQRLIVVLEWSREEVIFFFLFFISSNYEARRIPAHAVKLTNTWWEILHVKNYRNECACFLTALFEEIFAKWNKTYRWFHVGSV